MIKTLIVADDSTGANASAILLNQLNFTTLSLINYDEASSLKGYDGVAVSTDSRAVAPETAKTRVRKAIFQHENAHIPIVNKRIDSTLRGNIGAELSVFKERFPRKKIAIVPGFPDSNRFCEDGKLYVGDTLLENTDVAKDPKMPITSSVVKDLFKKQFDGSIANLYLDDIRSSASLKETITELYQTHDAIIFDATTNDDITKIAQTLSQIEREIITVDAGPFTYAYSKAKLTQSDAYQKRYLFLVGSVTQTTTNQLKYIKDNDAFSLHSVNAHNMIENQTATKEIDKTLKSINQDDAKHIVLTTNHPDNQDVLDLFTLSKKKGVSVDHLSKMINDNLAALLEKAYEQDPRFGGIYASGGDTALSFLNRTDAEGIQLLKQVIPLCVYGKIVGGRFDGIPIITKGGMIGNDDAYEQIKNFLQEVDNYG